MSSSILRRASKRVASVGVLVAAIGLPALAASAAPSSAHENEGHTSVVYTISNETAGNRVLAFSRAANGALTSAGSYATGGSGSGGGLGSQGSLVVTGEGEYLLAVNAGSDTITEFRIKDDGSLKLVGSAPSGGARPISIAVRGETAYVLNGAANTISGVRVGERLRPIANSTRALSGTGGAQVSFTPNGRQLVVTEKATNTIDTFDVRGSEVIGNAKPTLSTGQTPFGFAFDPRGHMLVSNAAGGAPGASSVTSYDVTRTGAVNVLAGPVATTQTAACWVVVSEDGRYAYTTNTGSGTISGYRVGADGSLTLLDASGVTATVGAGPIDASIVAGDLYVVNGRDRSISIAQIASNGSLAVTGTVTGLPASTVGLATI
jgi:6-phosphogluconolactonase